MSIFFPPRETVQASSGLSRTQMVYKASSSSGLNPMKTLLTWKEITLRFRPGKILTLNNSRSHLNAIKTLLAWKVKRNNIRACLVLRKCKITSILHSLNTLLTWKEITLRIRHVEILTLINISIWSQSYRNAANNKRA